MKEANTEHDIESRHDQPMCSKDAIFMFRRTLTVPHHGGEGIHVSMCAFACRHTSEVVQDSGMYSVLNHIKVNTSRVYECGCDLTPNTCCYPVLLRLCDDMRMPTCYYHVFLRRHGADHLTSFGT